MPAARADHELADASEGVLADLRGPAANGSRSRKQRPSGFVGKAQTGATGEGESSMRRASRRQRAPAHAWRPDEGESFLRSRREAAELSSLTTTTQHSADPAGCCRNASIPAGRRAGILPAESAAGCRRACRLEGGVPTEPTDHGRAGANRRGAKELRHSPGQNVGDCQVHSRMRGRGLRHSGVAWWDRNAPVSALTRKHT